MAFCALPLLEQHQYQAQALNLTESNPKEEALFAQTGAEFVDLILDTIKLGIKRLFPLEPVQQQKINGTKINLLGADKSAESHGGKLSGSNQGSGTMNPMTSAMGAFGLPMMAGSGKSEGFFGGSFFPQTYQEMEDESKALAFVQSTVGKSEQEVLAELSDLSGRDKKDILAQIQDQLNVDGPSFVEIIQSLG